jgi:hypothetical protein
MALRRRTSQTVLKIPGIAPQIACPGSGIDTTAYYAKADVTLLKQIAQPWPEVL